LFSIYFITFNELIGMNPHYAGRSAVPVTLTARVGPSELDGSFRGWVNPEGDAPATGYYEFVFDAPDYRLHEELSLPVLKEVQIAAFAHEIAGFETVAAYEASQKGDLKYASQCSSPLGCSHRLVIPPSRPRRWRFSLVTCSPRTKRSMC
jgi:hypothetical protein